MALNPFFTQGTSSEQSLVQSLINEQLRMYGVEVYYIPRKYLTKNTVIREVIQSKFDDAYPIEAYVNTYDGYEGQGTILSKFGVQPIDDLTLIISRERFENYISPLIKNLPNIELSTRPKEGDLIYFPLGDRLFEIKFVEHEQPFYQLQKTYVYELRCELFRYEDEVIDTDVEEIDDNIQEQGYIQTLSLIGIGSTATAVTTINDGGLQFITLLDDGYDYTESNPIVAISSAPSGGLTASALAYNNLGFGISSIVILNPGYGYSTVPGVSFISTTGSGAIATTGIGTTGTIGIITVTSGGSGYTTNPTVTFSGAPGGGTTATGYSILSGNSVSAIYITNSGAGYTEPPAISFAAPNTLGTGNYRYNEVVTGSVSGTTARVKLWNGSTNSLQVSIINGDFTQGEAIVGSESGASYAFFNVQNEKQDSVDTYSENIAIQTESDGILDFTRRNPFGEP
jgi:hypothetical protein